jgi:hypothetical protein
MRFLDAARRGAGACTAVIVRGFIGIIEISAGPLGVVLGTDPLSMGLAAAFR